MTQFRMEKGNSFMSSLGFLMVLESDGDYGYNHYRFEVRQVCDLDDDGNIQDVEPYTVGHKIWTKDEILNDMHKTDGLWSHELVFPDGRTYSVR